MTSFGYYEDEEVVDEVDELEIDDSLSSLEKIKKYTYSDIILHRLHLAREISELSKNVEFGDFIQVVIPSITQLSNDNESVIRQSLIEQLPELTAQLLKISGDEQISGVIIPVLDKLIIDESTQVRASSAESLISITKYLDSDKQKNLILPIINKLSTNPREEEYRIEAAEIIGKVAGVIEDETIKEFAIEQIKILSKDPMFRVRKAVALTIGSIAKICGADLATSSLLPIFLQLTKDEIWGVKKACTEAIVLLAQSVTLNARVSDLSQIYEILIQDNSRWVRNSAFQNLGQFITTLEADTEIPQSLFDHYCGMIEGLKNKYGDSDTILYCAYSFPGVLLTIGRNKWNLLKPVYSTLSKDLQWKVRRTLSHSLHEVAKILGTQLTEENLLGTFELFLNDLDQVKVGVIRHISSFLAILSTSSRNTYVSTLLDIQKESVNWRFRQLLAMQIGDIAELYSDEVINESIIPIAIQLCSDQVTSVRQSIASEIGKFVHHLTCRSPKLLNDFIDQIINFATKENCYDRQTYAQCCESLADNVEANVFIQHFYPHLITLSTDKVPNIRFIVSRLFNQKLTSDKFLEIQTQVQSVIEKLSQDTDKEVRFFANNVIRRI